MSRYVILTMVVLQVDGGGCLWLREYLDPNLSGKGGASSSDPRLVASGFTSYLIQHTPHKNTLGCYSNHPNTFTLMKLYRGLHLLCTLSLLIYKHPYLIYKHSFFVGPCGESL